MELPKRIQKRDGSVVDFRSQKIIDAVTRAGKATGEFEAPRAEEIVREHVLPSLEVDDKGVCHIEAVQDAVEQALFKVAASRRFAPTSSTANRAPRCATPRRAG